MRNEIVEPIPVDLSDDELSELDRAFPRGAGSAAIGRRALQIVRLHFRKLHPGCRFAENPPEGAALAVFLEGDSEPTVIEVKGTNADHIVWEQIRIQGFPSHELLTTGRSQLYRVTHVSSRRPLIYRLTHGEHFTLERAPRWRVKRVVRS
jgi:hypothetical protein